MNYYQIKYTGDEINELLGRINQDNFLEVVQDSHIIYEDLFELLSEESIVESVLKYLNTGFAEYFRTADGTKLAYEDLQPELKDILNKGKEIAVDNNETIEAVCFSVNEQVMFIFNISANGFALIMRDAHNKTVTITSDFANAVIIVDENANKRDIEKAVEGLASEEFVRAEVAKLVNAAPEAMDTLKELADAIEGHQDVYDAYVDEVAKKLENKVDKVEGKSLVDDAEIERLADVHNFDDSELKDMINAIEIPSVEGLASEEFVREEIAKIEIPEIPEIDLEPYAKKEDLFSKDYNDLENKPEIPSIEGLAVKEEVDLELAKKIDAEEGKVLISEEELARLEKVDNYDDSELRELIEEKANKEDLFTWDYNDLDNKPVIPSTDGLATEQFVLGKIAEAKLEGEEVDLSIYATKEDLEELATKEEIQDFLIEEDLDGLATEAFVREEIAKIEIPEIPEIDLEPYAKKEDLFNKDYNELINKPEIPSIEGLASEQFVLGKIAEIEHPQYDDSELRGMFIVDEPKKAVFNNRPYVFACGHPLLVEGKDGEVVITYAVNDTNKEMGEIRVPAEEAKSLVIVGGFGDEHIDRTRILPATHIHVRNVDIQAVYGGNLFEGIVGESTIIIENSSVKEVIGGGDAGRFIEGRWAVRNNVAKVNVKLTDVKSSLVFIGGSGGPSNVAEANIELNGNCEIAWLTAGGSNGFTSKSEVVINGGQYECVQMVNRGLVDEAKLVMNGGHVARAYFAGEAEDATVTGIVNHVVFELNAGEIGKLARGNSNSIEFNGDIKGHIIDCVVLEGDVSMLEKVEHVEEPDYATEEFVRAEIEAIEHPQYDDSELREMIESIEHPVYDDSELREMIEGKANKEEIPSIEGLASEDYVKNAIAEAQLSDKEVDLSGLATKDELKGLASEEFVNQAIEAIEHPQYDDSELREMIEAIEVPSVEGLATESFVEESIAAIEHPQYDDSELREMIEAIEVPSVDGLATEEFVREEIAAIEHPVYDDSELRELINNIVVPDIEGYATQDFVREEVAKLVDAAPEAMDTLGELADAIEAHQDVYEGFVAQQAEALAKKVDAVEGKDLMDVAEIERLANVDNYDDSELREMIENIEVPSVEGLASEEFVNQAIEAIEHPQYDDSELREMIESIEVPSVEGLATEEFVNQAIEAIEQYDDTDVKARLDALEAVEAPNLEEFASKEFVAQQIAEIEHPQYDDSELRNMINDIVIPDLEGYATEDYVKNAIAEAELSGGDTEVDLSGFATKDELALKANKEELFSGSYNDLTDKPEIPSIDGLATEEFVAQQIEAIEMPEEYDDAELRGRIEALEEVEMPEIPSIDGLATEEFVNQAIAAIEHPQYDDTELREMIEAIEVPSIEGLATEQFVKDEIAKAQLEGEEVDLSGYATKEDLANIEHPQYDDTDVKARLDALESVEMPEIPSVEGLASEEFVREEVAKLVNAAPEAMDTLGELAAAISAHEGVYEGFVAQQTEALAKKVDAVEGFALADEAEMARLKDVHNYDDTDVKARLDALEDVEMPEVPSIEGLATKEELQQAIEGIEHPTVDLEPYAKKEDLFSKDYNDLENKPEIPEAYDDTELRGMIEAIEVPSVEGLATEEFVQQEIAKIEFPEVPEVDLSEYAKLEALENKVDKEEGKSLIADSEIVRLATLANPNYTFKINMLPAGSEASVTTSGMYPNQIITFNIPMGTVTGGDEGGEDVPAGTPRMWYGFMSYDESGETGFNEPDHINENMTKRIIDFGLAKGTLKEEDPSAKGKVVVTGLLDADFLCVIVPVDAGLKAWVDDGIGGKIPFLEMDPSSGLAQDDCVLVTPIDGITYKVSGMYITNGGGDMTIYIDKK